MSKSTKKPIVSDDSSEEEEEYEVEKILKWRLNPKTKKKEYLVKWENYPFESSTWEPEVNLRNVRDIIEEFEAQQKLRGGHTLTDSASVVQQKKNSSTNNSLLGSSNKKPPLQQTATATQSKKPQNTATATVTTTNANSSSGRMSAFMDRELGNQQHKKSQKQQEKSPSRIVSSGLNSNVAFNPNNDDDDFEDGQVEYIFEKIENKRIVKGKAEYLVSFQGLSQSQWVEEGDLEDFAIEVDLYNQNEKQAAALELQKTLEKTIEKQSSTIATQIEDEDMDFENNTPEIEKPSAIAGNAVAKTMNAEKQAKGNPVVYHATPKKHLSGGQHGKQQLKTVSGKQPEVREFIALTTTTAAEMSQMEALPKKSKKESRVNSNKPRVETTPKKNASVGVEQDGQLIEEEEIQCVPKQSKLVEELAAKSKQPNDLVKRTKRTAVNSADVDSLVGTQFEEVHGDFQQDNMESITVLGDYQSIFSCRILVKWRPRDDGKTPMATVFSSSYLRKHEPDVLIDYLMGVVARNEDGSK